MKLISLKSRSEKQKTENVFGEKSVEEVLSFMEDGTLKSGLENYLQNLKWYQADIARFMQFVIGNQFLEDHYAVYIDMARFFSGDQAKKTANYESTFEAYKEYGVEIMAVIACCESIDQALDTWF